MIRILEPTDIQGLNKLPPLDWKFDYEDFLHDFQEDDFFHGFVMTEGNEIVGTGNVFLHDKVGWLANIIVSENFRCKGLGGKMTKFLVDFLNEKGCETQLLIATLLGERVYEKIGFRKVTEYVCFDSEKDIDHKISRSIRELKTENLPHVYEMDRLVNGEDRKHLISKFTKDGLGYFDDQNEMKGFYLPNYGRGLVLALEANAGIELLGLKHSKKGMRTQLPIENQIGIEFLEQNGLKKGLKSSKMILGKEISWNPSFIFSYASGYCG